MNINFLAVSLLNPSQTTNLPRPAATSSTLDTFLSVTLITLGAIALMVLVISGFRYTISGGDPTKVADAKRSMIYALVGLVVAASAYIIVQTVLNHTSVGT